jgi:hypothetical protein
MSQGGIVNEDQEQLSHVDRRKLWKKERRRLKRQAAAKQKEESMLCQAVKYKRN